MKKSLLAVAVLGAFAGAANAQSSVTLYGIGEATLEIGRKETLSVTTTALTTGIVPAGTVSTQRRELKPGLRLQDGNSEGLGTSRFGLRGAEDLGGGMKATFQFEAGLRIDDGTVTPGGGSNGGGSGDSGGAFFGRTAKIGLSGGFGSVELGRMLNPAFLVQGNSWAAGSANGLYDAGSSTAPLMGGVRTSNAIMYATPNLGGFTAKLLYGAAEAKQTDTTITITPTPTTTTTTNLTKANPKFDAALEFANGPIYVGFGYDRAKSGAVSTAGVSSSTDVKGYTAGGSFDLGFVKPFVNYSRQETAVGNGNATVQPIPNNSFGAVTLPVTSANLEEKAWSIGVTMPLGTMRLVAGYGVSTTDVSLAQATGVRGAGEVEETAYQIGLFFPLSRRTTITSNIGQYKTDWGTNGFVLSNASGVATTRITAESKRQAFAVGVRHLF
jgi:predicted porin